MKILSEKRAGEQLKRLKEKFAAEIRDGFEYAAKNCLTCESQGVCCLDAHFVNVHITRLEAVSFSSALRKLAPEHTERVMARIDDAVESYGLTESGDTFSLTYACPLFEKGTGCLVHKDGKPAACIHHACYESEGDLPPDELLEEQQDLIDSLNKRVYGVSRWLPLPVWLKKVWREDSVREPAD